MMRAKKNQKKRFKLVVATHLFLIKNGQILLLRRFNTGYRDGQYSVPAGHLDGSESSKIAMVREIKEEIGINIKPNDLEFVHLMHRLAEYEGLDFFFTAKNWRGTPKIMEKNKCDDLRWFPIDKLPKNMVPYVRSAISSFRKNKVYSEFGWLIPDEE